MLPGTWSSIRHLLLGQLCSQKAWCAHHKLWNISWKSQSTAKHQRILPSKHQPYFHFSLLAVLLSENKKEQKPHNSTIIWVEHHILFRCILFHIMSQLFLTLHLYNKALYMICMFPLKLLSHTLTDGVTVTVAGCDTYTHRAKRRNRGRLPHTSSDKWLQKNTSELTCMCT